MASFWNWLIGAPNQNTDGSSPVFSYVLLGAAVLLLVAVIFGELETIE